MEEVTQFSSVEAVLLVITGITAEPSVEMSIELVELQPLLLVTVTV